MWAVVRGVAIWLFGDDVVRIILYAVAGLFVVTYVEVTGATTAIMAQPWGQWWLAGARGGTQVGAIVDTPLADPLPTMLPVPGFAVDRTTAIIANAMTWLGVRYLWGGCTRNGVDCSCFVQNALRAAGVQGVPRTTITQIAWTRPVPRDQIRAADLLYFDNTCTGCGPNPTHVGIALDGRMMIHAGDPVHIESYDTPNWRALFNSAGRIP